MRLKNKAANIRNIQYTPMRRQVPAEFTAAEDADSVLALAVKSSAVKIKVAGIFSNPRSAERELYLILLHSAIKARKAGYDTKINVRIDSKNNMLVMSDESGIGIPWKKFYTETRVIGRGDNMLAHTGLSDMIRFETSSRETGEFYCFTCKKGKSVVKIDAPQMPEFGTRMSITLNGKASMNDLVYGMIECARFSGIETHLDLSFQYDYAVHKSIYADPEFPPTMTAGVPLPTSTIGERIRHSSDSAKFQRVSIRGPKYRLVGHFWLDSELADQEGRRETYLNGLPIENTMDVPLFDWCMTILGDADEIATTDRERLTSEAEMHFAENIAGKLQKHFDKLNIMTLDDYRKSGNKDVYGATFGQLRHRNLTDDTYQMVHFLEQFIIVAGASETIRIRDAIRARKTAGMLMCMDGTGNKNTGRYLKKKYKNCIPFKFVNDNSFQNLSPAEAGRFGLQYVRDLPGFEA